LYIPYTGTSKDAIKNRLEELIEAGIINYLFFRASLRPQKTESPQRIIKKLLTQSKFHFTEHYRDCLNVQFIIFIPESNFVLILEINCNKRNSFAKKHKNGKSKEWVIKNLWDRNIDRGENRNDQMILRRWSAPDSLPWINSSGLWIILL
jgi:hypothetical protein